MPTPENPKARPRSWAKIAVAAAALAALWFTLAVARQEGMLAWLPPPVGETGVKEVALASSPLSPSEAREAIQRESGHIAACSYTGAGADAGSDGYGALNDDPISGRGPDWVMTEPGAVGAISLLHAAAFLRAQGDDVKTLDTALDGYFDVWLVRHRQGWITDSRDADLGGMASRVAYDSQGKFIRRDEATPAATGMAVVALWKRYEYLRDTGQGSAGRAWLLRAWSAAEPAGRYLRAHFDPKTGLERGPASSPDEWLTDAVAATDGLLCLDRWAMAIGKPDPQWQAAARLKTGIAAMREDDERQGYFRLRDHRRRNQPSNGDSIDQIAFLPYEADVLDPADPFVKRISDSWTRSGPTGMTAQAGDPAQWTYFGTHWHHFFSPRLENDYLYPGPGLQLAKVEWKYARRTHDKAVYERAVNRLRWTVSPKYSALWQPGGGLVDWRDSRDYSHTAADWARFIDTSGYLIQVVLMVNFNQDTQYVPEASPRPVTQPNLTW